MPLNFDLAGKAYDPQIVTVTADQIAAYAAASGDPNPAHQAGVGQVASAVFPVVPAFAAMGAAVLDPELGVDNPLMIVHGEQRFDYYRVIRPGDELTLHPSLESVADKGSGAAFVTKVAVLGSGADPVVDVYATIFVRGAGSGGKRPAAPREEPVTGDLVCSFIREVKREMPARYAEASGDHNPIHLDEGVARAVGLPGAINHGLGSLSLVGGGLVAELCDGDVARLHSLQCRFMSPVLPGEELTTTVWSGVEGAFQWEAARPSGTAALKGTAAVDST